MTKRIKVTLMVYDPAEQAELLRVHDEYKRARIKKDTPAYLKLRNQYLEDCIRCAAQGQPLPPDPFTPKPTYTELEQQIEFLRSNELDSGQGSMILQEDYDALEKQLLASKPLVDICLAVRRGDYFSNADTPADQVEKFKRLYLTVCETVDQLGIEI